MLGGALGLLLVMAGYVVFRQHANGFVSDINWPTHFGVANSLVWISLFLFAGDALAQWARSRSGSGSAHRPTSVTFERLGDRLRSPAGSEES